MAAALSFFPSPSPDCMLQPRDYPENRQDSFVYQLPAPTSERHFLSSTPANLDGYASLLRECIQYRILEGGLRIHDHLVRNELDDDCYLGNILIAMYDKCGALKEARSIFDSLTLRNVYTWNNIISAYAYHGHDTDALQLFRQMLSSDFPTVLTFKLTLSACANLESLWEGKFVHENAVYYGLDDDHAVQTALVYMYGKCGSTRDAERLFKRLHDHDVVSFTVLVTIHIQQEQHKDALDVFKVAFTTGIEMDAFILSATLGACTGLAALEEGRWIHSLIIKGGFHSNCVIETALINMYGVFGCLREAETIFLNAEHSAAIFNAMITSYVQLGHGDSALQLFRDMQVEGIKVNELTYVSVITACADMGFLMDGKVLCHMIISDGLESNFVVGSAIVNMFGKCGCPVDAQSVFEKLSERTTITWNGLIAAYLQQGDGDGVLEVYHRMLSEDVKPTDITFVNVLSACGSLSSLQEGMSVHSSITKLGLDLYCKIGNALVSMYGKCGSLKDAYATFSKMPEQEVISWNTIITAYTQNGCYKEALDLFKQMQQQGVKPDEVTLVTVVSACSHAGLITEGLQYFFLMGEKYGLEPTMKHYGCVIDLLSRAGQLDKADYFIDNMPVLPDSTAWKSFLAACKLHGNGEWGKHAADTVAVDDWEDGAFYVLLADMHATVSNLDRTKV